MIVIFAGLRMIVDLYLVSIVHRHPFLFWFYRDTDENARVVVRVLHFIHDVKGTVGEFAAGPVEEAHSPMTVEQAVIDAHATRSDVLPAGEVLAVKKLLNAGWSRAAAEEEERKEGVCN